MTESMEDKEFKLIPRAAGKKLEVLNNFINKFKDTKKNLLVGVDYVCMSNEYYRDLVQEKMEWLKSVAPEVKHGSDSYLYGHNDYRKELFANAEKSLKGEK